MNTFELEREYVSFEICFDSRVLAFRMREHDVMFTLLLQVVAAQSSDCQAQERQTPPGEEANRQPPPESLHAGNLPLRRAVKQR